MLSIESNLFLWVTEFSRFGMKLLGVTITKKYGLKHTQILVLYISILYSELNVSRQLQFALQLQSRPRTQGDNLKLHQCSRTKLRGSEGIFPNFSVWKQSSHVFHGKFKIIKWERNWSYSFFLFQIFLLLKRQTITPLRDLQAMGIFSFTPLLLFLLE